jgi:hypothetical protein
MANPSDAGLFLATLIWICRSRTIAEADQEKDIEKVNMICNAEKDLFQRKREPQYSCYDLITLSALPYQ